MTLPGFLQLIRTVIQENKALSKKIRTSGYTIPEILIMDSAIIGNSTIEIKYPTTSPAGIRIKLKISACKTVLSTFYGIKF
jgi:hypothetical protein